MGAVNMNTPVLEVNLSKVTHNVKMMKELCNSKGIDICIVTKGFCAELPIVQAIVNSGVNFFADSRIQNIKKVKNVLPNVRYMLVRIPKISEASDVIEYTDISLQSQLEIIKVYSVVAERLGKVHDIILMVDVGDLREGILPENILETVKDILPLTGVRLVGIGTNVGCYGGIMPTIENTEILVKLKNDIKKKFGLDLEYISGGSTCTTKLLYEGNLPKEINNLRIGEAVILGEDSTNGIFIDGLYNDAFILHAEVIELKAKPSVPIGEMGYDAFGCKPVFEDNGLRKRAILSVGRQDVRIEALTPIYEGAKILGASSDHLLLDITDCSEKIEPGSIVTFRCAYSAVLTLTTSPYVYKEFIE